MRSNRQGTGKSKQHGIVPLFHDIEFLRRPRPSPVGKKGPNSVKAPPPIEEQPGPEDIK